jgi:DNA end-binding protein Ku
MATRASWSGYVKVSLLNVPVKAYSATTADAGKISLRQLHDGCWHRLKQQMTCPVHGPVAAENIASGYEAAEGEYVVLSDEELASLDEKEDRTVEIHAFVSSTHIDPVHYTEKTWYLTPNGPAGERVYALLRGGLVSGERHAVGRAVINRRAQPVLLRPIGRLVALTVLRYDAQVSKPEAFEEMAPGNAVTDEESALFGQLVDSMAQNEFSLEKYRDEHAERLARLIEARSSERVTVPMREPETVTTNDQLMELLIRSVQKKSADWKLTPCGEGQDSSSPELVESSDSRLKRPG